MINIKNLVDEADRKYRRIVERMRIANINRFNDSYDTSNVTVVGDKTGTVLLKLLAYYDKLLDDTKDIARHKEGSECTFIMNDSVRTSKVVDGNVIYTPPNFNKFILSTTRWVDIINYDGKLYVLRLSSDGPSIFVKHKVLVKDTFDIGYSNIVLSTLDDDVIINSEHIKMFDELAKVWVTLKIIHGDIRLDRLNLIGGRYRDRDFLNGAVKHNASGVEYYERNGAFFMSNEDGMHELSDEELREIDNQETQV